MRFERENSLPKITISIRAQIKKNNTSVFVMKQFTHKPQKFRDSFPLSIQICLFIITCTRQSERKTFTSKKRVEGETTNEKMVLWPKKRLEKRV